MREPMTVICLSPVRWDGLFQRHQQLMTLFAERDRVVFVDPFTSLGDAPFGALRKKPVTMAGPNIAVLSSLHPLTASRSQWVMGLAMGGLAGRIEALLGRLGWGGPRILWLARPEGFSLAGCLGEKMCVYDCVDEHWAFLPENSHGAQVIDLMEMKTLRKADAVIATSSRLCRKISLVHPRVREIGNGVDPAVFTPRPARERRGRKNLVAGFAGAMYEWVDLDLVAGMAMAFPEVSFLMVGPVRGSGATGVPHNLCFTGRAAYPAVAARVRNFDLGLVPFRVNGLTGGADPIKIYEYLACGLPIVSTPIAEASKFGDLVRVGRTPAHFEEELSRAIEEAETITDRQIELRREAAVSWRERFAAIVDFLGLGEAR